MQQSAAAGHAQFSRLFEAHYAQVLAFAGRRVGPDLADEVTAETFLVAWRRLESVPAEPLPWLYGVARNIVMRQLRASSRHAEMHQLLARERTALEVDAGEHDALWRAFELLSERDREILALVAWEELSVRDAATVLGVPASVVSVRLHRARRRLERNLRQPTSSPVPEIPEAI